MQSLKKAMLWGLGGSAGAFLAINFFGSLYIQRTLLRPLRKLNRTSDLNGFIPKVRYSTSEIQFAAADGIRISAYLLVPENPNGHSIVVCHGLAHNKNSGVRFVQYLLQDGYTLLLIDFRNHGESEGKVTTYGYFEKQDILAAVRYLRETALLTGRIGILGASMGASIALLAACETEEIHALVCDSPFSSLRKISLEWATRITRLPKFLLLLPMQLAYLWISLFVHCCVPEVEPRHKVKQMRCPLLLIHGGADGIIPVSHSHEIFENAGAEKELWIIDQADHLGVYLTDSQEYERRVLKFFRKNLIGCA